MKKIISIVLIWVCVLGLVGCQKAVRGSEVYSFPEPTTQITGIFYSQGAEKEFVIGPDEYDPKDLSVMPVIEWFYGLELNPCEQPEDVEGAESYSFEVKGDLVFSYQDRGNEAYIIVSDTWYRVKNPSVPPIGSASTYKTEDDDTGAVSLAGETKADLEFEAQYIRTNGYHEEVEYPLVKIIRSVEELNNYYDANKEKYDLERKGKVYSDTTIGFLDACDRYDEAYFEKQILIMVLLEEGSGSIRHKVNSLSMVDDDKWIIVIETVAPDVGTDDMAAWHILIEPEAGINVESESNVTVLLNGIDPLTQPETVRHSRGYANISLTIPDGWEYYAENNGDENDFCIAFWPEGQTEGKIKVWYYDSFGVCGTGLEEKKITIGEYEAYQGTYDNKKVWDFISFIGMPGSYVVLNEGTDKWWGEYGEEAMQILATVKIAEGVIDEAEAIEMAKKNVTVEYDQTRARFDVENGLWTVSFSKKNTAGGNQVVTITHEGKIIDEEYGE